MEVLRYVVVFILRTGTGTQFALPLAVALIVDSIVAVVFVFILAIRVYSVAAGVVLGFLTLIPLLGLVMLLIVNGKATRIIRSNGFRVGLLGAELWEIKNS
jgi:hypothetical protein